MAKKRAESVRPVQRRREASVARGSRFFALPELRSAGHLPDVVLYGVPSEVGVVDRHGTSAAPGKLRYISHGFGGHSQPFGLEVFDALAVADGGDLLAGESLKAVAVASEACARAGQIPGMLGGSQLVTLHALEGILRAKKRAVRLLHLDAFHDLEAGEPSERSALRHIVEQKLVRKEQVLQLGVRGPMSTGAEYQLALGSGFEVTHTDDIRFDVHSAVRQLREFVAQGSVYVSIDLSVVDPASAPASTRVSPGGLSMWEVQQLLRGVVGAELVGFDLVGYSPHYDAGEIAGYAASSIVFEMLAAIGESRRALDRGKTNRGTGRRSA
jgi:agmatinase